MKAFASGDFDELPPSRSSFANLSSLSSGFSTPTAQYKRIPIFPLVSPAVDHHHSNNTFLRLPCTTCFPQPSMTTREKYVDLLEFSQYNGVPWELAPGVPPPRRWFADIRYTLATPLPHRYPMVQKELMDSKRIANAMSLQLASDPTLTASTVRRRVMKCYKEIRATLSRFVCKICAYVLVKIFRRLMSKLLISPPQIERVKTAYNTGIPLVYLPLHKSHLDYLLITWAGWHFGLPLPHIASGDNLNLSGFGWLLRATGAFFIRRRLDPSDEGGKDALYRSVLHSYIEQLLIKGLPIEFFLEGTRSRFGKPLIPKHGLISNVVDAVQQGIIQDCYLVPVSYTYDQVAEGLFLEELMGLPKVRESFVGIVRGVLKGFGIAKRCGTVRMHYGQPILLTEYLGALSAAVASMDRPREQTLSRIPQTFSYRELVPWHRSHIDKVDKRKLIRAIGYHVVYEAQAQVSMSLVSVVSALLLCKYRETVSMDDLSADVSWLCGTIIRCEGDVLGWRENETCGRSAVEYAVPYIRDCIVRVNDSITPINEHRSLVQLAHAKNALVPLFAIKSVTAISIISLKGDASYEEIIKRAKAICELLSFEVIFCKPCEKIEACVLRQLDEWCTSDPLLHRYLIRRDVYLTLEEEMRISSFEILEGNCYSKLLFFSNMLRPFLVSLRTCALKLMEGKSYDRENVFIRNLCKESIEANKESLKESINSDSYRNSLRLFRNLELVNEYEPKVEVLSISGIAQIADQVEQMLIT